MSRIGKHPITIPEGVEIKIEDNGITVKGKKGELHQDIDSSISVEQKDGELLFERSSENPNVKSKHGLYRALVANMIQGVTEGYKKELEIIGVGYRVAVKGQRITLNIGFAHPIVIEIAEEVKATAVTEKGKAPILTLESIDKQLLGAVTAKIRSFRKPEPYKGKGIRIKGEYIRRKAGKAAG